MSRRGERERTITEADGAEERKERMGKRERKIAKPQPPSAPWACATGPRGTPCKISHKDRRPCTIMAPGAACPVARIPRDLVGDRYDEALALCVAACLVLRV